MQALTFAMNQAFEFLNFAIAYSYGLWLMSMDKTTPYIVFQ